METSFRALARRWPAVVVGPALASTYSRGRAVLEISVSLIREADIGTGPATRSYSGELTALSVGRLETEKNPVALADVIAALRRIDDRWRLVICGEGAMRVDLERRLEELDVMDAVEIRGYVAHDAGLRDAYRSSHALVHVSWTEGLPQVLYEAFAAELPVVATDVGGIHEAVGDAALLVGPGDPDGIAEQLARIGRDAGLRTQLIERGLAAVRAHTLESETTKVAGFIEAATGPN
jgi:glycosyltransferase involved in cell wall biosynthesis